MFIYSSLLVHSVLYIPQHTHSQLIHHGYILLCLQLYFLHISCLVTVSVIDEIILMVGPTKTRDYD